MGEGLGSRSGARPARGSHGLYSRANAPLLVCVLVYVSAWGACYVCVNRTDARRPVTLLHARDARCLLAAREFVLL